MEADIAVLGDDGRMADLIDGALGEDSLFHETHGYYGHGVTEATARLPSGWRERLIPHAEPATNGVTALCLEPHDLWLSKACAGRPKDARFCAMMADEGLVDVKTLRERAKLMDGLTPSHATRLNAWISQASQSQSRKAPPETTSKPYPGQSLDAGPSDRFAPQKSPC